MHRPLGPLMRPGRHFVRHFPPVDLLRIFPGGHGGTRQRLDERLRVCPSFVHLGNFFLGEDFRLRDLRVLDLRLRDLRVIDLIFRQRPDFERIRVVFPGTHFTRHLLFDLLRIIPVGHGDFLVDDLRLRDLMLRDFRFGDLRPRDRLFLLRQRPVTRSRVLPLPHFRLRQ